MIEQKDTGLQKIKPIDSLDAYVDNIKKLEIIAETIAASSTWSEPFKVKREDGTMEVSKSAIVSNLMIGLELGFTPMQSLMLGSKLNANSILAVQRGRAMGFNPTDSLSLIHILEDKKNSKITIYAGVHAIKACLLRNGIIHEFIKVYEPVYKYYNMITLEEVKESDIYEDGLVKSDYWFCNKVDSDIIAANNSGKAIIVKNFQYYESVVKFTRTYPDKSQIVREYRYDSIMAATAGKIPVQLADGSWTEGKNTWVSMPFRMYPKEVYINGARDIASDVIFDTYTPDEVTDFTDSSIIEDADAEVLS